MRLMKCEFMVFWPYTLFTYETYSGMIPAGWFSTAITQKFPRVLTEMTLGISRWQRFSPNPYFNHLLKKIYLEVLFILT